MRLPVPWPKDLVDTEKALAWTEEARRLRIAKEAERGTATREDAEESWRRARMADIGSASSNEEIFSGVLQT